MSTRKVSAIRRKALAADYGVTSATLGAWITMNPKLAGLRDLRIFTPAQVRLLIRVLGFLDCYDSPEWNKVTPAEPDDQQNWTIADVQAYRMDQPEQFWAACALARQRKLLQVDRDYQCDPGLLFIRFRHFYDAYRTVLEEAGRIVLPISTLQEVLVRDADYMRVTRQRIPGEATNVRLWMFKKNGLTKFFY